MPARGAGEALERKPFSVDLRGLNSWVTFLEIITSVSHNDERPHSKASEAFLAGGSLTFISQRAKVLLVLNE